MLIIGYFSKMELYHISSQFCSILSSNISLETSFQDVSNDILHGRIGQELNEILLKVEFTGLPKIKSWSGEVVVFPKNGLFNFNCDIKTDREMAEFLKMNASKSTLLLGLFNPFSVRSVVLTSVYFVLFAYMIITVNSTHQRWWIYGCQCSNWESRNSVREIVMKSYRGLFVGRDDLLSLPVVKLHKNPGEANIQSYVANTLPHINKFINPGCCFTDYKYEIFNTTSVSTQEFKVVHFEQAFQFVPTGRCRKNSTCSRGECIQMYRHHWMLVWDERISTWPPVTFLPVEVPSHCQCVNVGRGTQRRRRRKRDSCATEIYISMKEHQDDVPSG